MVDDRQSMIEACWAGSIPAAWRRSRQHLNFSAHQAARLRLASYYSSVAMSIADWNLCTDPICRYIDRMQMNRGSGLLMVAF